MSSGAETGEPPGSGGPAQSREVLDDAVRCLALGTGGIRGRVEMAGAIVLRGLSREELPDGEQRERFERIELALGELEPADRRVGSDAEMVADADPGAEAIAAQILDLRDTLTERAIRGARREDMRRQGG